MVGNIANGIAFKIIFAFLTELGNFKEKFFGGNVIRNIAKQKSAALSRADDSGQCVTKKSINFPHMNYLVTRKHQHYELGIFMIGNFV